MELRGAPLHPAQAGDGRPDRVRYSASGGDLRRQIARTRYDELDFNNLRIAPTMRDQHYFGTDLLGRTLQPGQFGSSTSVWVAPVVYERDDGDLNDDRR